VAVAAVAVMTKEEVAARAAVAVPPAVLYILAVQMLQYLDIKVILVVRGP
jgi:hypothetical protein